MEQSQHYYLVNISFKLTSHFRNKNVKWLMQLFSRENPILQSYQVKLLLCKLILEVFW